MTRTIRLCCGCAVLACLVTIARATNETQEDDDRRKSLDIRHARAYKKYYFYKDDADPTGDPTGVSVMPADPTPTAAQPKKKSSFISKILPLLVVPFLISSSLIPVFLTSLKFMLLKSLFVGKVALFLIALNAFWKTDNRGGVYSHNINLDRDQQELHKTHYGYNGDEEYGAYVNRKAYR